jgi:hypothetical protein
MPMANRATLALVSALLLSACAATESAKDRSIFMREAVTKKVYAADLTVCDLSAKQKSASDGERTGATALGFLAGGIIGAAAAGSAYEKSQNRLFEECMFAKGYRLIALPQGFGLGTAEAASEFDSRQTALGLIEANQADELIAWENAKNAGTRDQLERYLSAYPNGHFANDARSGLTGINGAQGSAAK